MEKNERISLETAKLAKEKGFNWLVDQSYTEYLVDQLDPDYPEGGGAFSMTKGEIEIIDFGFRNNFKDTDYSNEKYQMYARPTQAYIQKWLREVHNTHIMIQIVPLYPSFIFHTVHMPNGVSWSNAVHFKTYDEALEAGITRALETIK